MSHDIRTPLNAVIGLAGLGADSDNPDEMRNYLRQIGDSGEYLRSLINDVLDMSKIENKMLRLHPQATYLPQFLREVISIVTPAIEEKKIAFVLKRTGIEEQYLRLDRTYVTQVSVNLLSNAVKFTPEGGTIEMRLDGLSRTQTHAKSRITVRDTGIGISEDFLPRVFLPFEQENAVNDATRRGTGLGLSIVKSIVDLMGGSIWVESEKGVGTTFIIEWEFEIARPEEIEQESVPEVPGESLRGKRVLLCEDHPLNAQIATRLLEKKQVLVETVEDGRLALQAFSAAPIGYYDAILMDIRMPVMDGLAATRAIRALPRPDAAAIPIIAMTANAFEEDAHKSFAAGMNAHLAKPIEPLLLYQTLAGLMGQA